MTTLVPSLSLMGALVRANHPPPSEQDRRANAAAGVHAARVQGNEDNYELKEALRQRGFGAWLASVRRAAGVTLALLRTKLDIPVSFLSDIENGKSRFPDERIEAWAREIGLDPVLLATIVLYIQRPVVFAHLSRITGDIDIRDNRAVEDARTCLQRGTFSPISIIKAITRLGDHKQVQGSTIEAYFDQGVLLGFYLRLARGELTPRPTQADVAMALHYAQSAVSFIEAGRLSIQDDKLEAWARLLRLEEPLFYSLALHEAMPNAYRLTTGARISDHEPWRRSGFPSISTLHHRPHRSRRNRR
jgi:transcriptional regulator with XRE-family HTH domain